MLQVSDPALDLLKDALISERTQDGDVFKLNLRDDTFVLNMEQPADNDVRYDLDGMTVLAASPEIAGSLLGETTIDLETTQEGPRLVILADQPEQ